MVAVADYVIRKHVRTNMYKVKYKSNDESTSQINESKNLQTLTQHDSKTYLRSPSTSGRSFVIAITNAKNVTKVVIKTTGELQVDIQEQTHKLETMDENLTSSRVLFIIIAAT